MKFLKRRRGQAMVEYSVINFLLFVTFLGGGFPFLIQMLKALSAYFVGIYFVLTNAAI